MKTKKIRCKCGVLVTPWQQKFHERSIWHAKWEFIRRCIAARMTKSQIARAIGASPAYVGMRLNRRTHGKVQQAENEAAAVPS